MTTKEIKSITAALMDILEPKLRRIIREELAIRLSGEVATDSAGIERQRSPNVDYPPEYNPLLMDDRQLRYAESLLGTDEERKILRIRVMAERLAVRYGNISAANKMRRQADRLENKFLEARNVK